MFGKPEWFRPKRWGWGLTPITWQGWAYTLASAGVLVVPFLLLLARSQAPEAFIWLGASMAVLVWDVKQILAAKGHGCRRAPSPGNAASPAGPAQQENTFAKRFRYCSRR